MADVIFLPFVLDEENCQTIGKIDKRYIKPIPSKYFGVIEAVNDMKTTKGKQEEIQKYLDSLTQDDLLYIIKYGLRGSNAPEGVTVNDIYYLIQSNPLEE